MEVPERPLAFVLMPFDIDFDDIYEELIKQPLEDAGFTTRRADSILNQRSVLSDVVRGIADAQLVVADVTGLNPNVLYELGLAHALGKRTVMLTQSLEELPFDLRPYRAIEYSVRFNQATDLQTGLRALAESVLVNEIQFGNPVQDFAPEAMAGGPGAMNFHSSREGQSDGSEGLRASTADEEPEPGLLELVVRMQEGSEQTAELTDQIGKAVLDVGSRVEHHTERLETAQKNLGERVGMVAVGIFRDAAKDLDRFTDIITPLNTQLREAVGAVGLGVNALAQHRDVSDPEDLEKVRREVESLAEAESSMSDAYANVAGFAAVISNLPHLESNLTKAARRASREVSLTAEVIETARSEVARARSLLLDRLGAS